MHKVRKKIQFLESKKQVFQYFCEDWGAAEPQGTTYFWTLGAGVTSKKNPEAGATWEKNSGAGAAWERNQEPEPLGKKIRSCSQKNYILDKHKA